MKMANIILLPLDGGGLSPAPRRVQDNALNLIWFRGGGGYGMVPLTPAYRQAPPPSPLPAAGRRQGRGG